MFDASMMKERSLRDVMLLVLDLARTQLEEIGGFNPLLIIVTPKEGEPNGVRYLPLDVETKDKWHLMIQDLVPPGGFVFHISDVWWAEYDTPDGGRITPPSARPDRREALMVIAGDNRKVHEQVIQKYSRNAEGKPVFEAPKFGDQVWADNVTKH